MTTATADRKAQKETVSVLCSGLACDVGFALTPEGFEASYAHFKPGVPLELEKHYADFLIAQDKTRFSIVEITNKKFGQIVSVDKEGRKSEAEIAADKAAKKDAAKAAKKADKAAKKAAKAKAK